MRKKNILIIEHDKQDWKRTKDKFEHFNVEKFYEFNEIIDDLEICLETVKSTSLDKYDAIFLDVYFWSEKDEIDEIFDKDEAYVLLDLIREKAPWIPVIAFTQHLDQGKLTYEISKRQYDAILPKKYIKKNSSFCIELLDQIIENAVRNRQNIIHSYDRKFLKQRKVNQKIKENIEVEMDSISERYFNRYFNDKIKLNAYFQYVFPHHERIIINKLSDGFSGNQVFEITAWSKEKRFGKESSWFMKTGNNISELQEELRAYKDIQNCGLHHQYFPPLLHYGIVAENTVGTIVYQLEESCFTLFRLLENLNEKDFEIIINKLFEVLSYIQGECAYESGLVKKHYIDEIQIKKIYVDIEKEIKIPGAIKSSSNLEKLLNLKIDFRKSLIHGDLHTRNIMVNRQKKIYLIDFAKADYKPTVFDVIKLELDTDIRIYQLKKYEKSKILSLIQNKWNIDSVLNESWEVHSKIIRKAFFEKNKNINENEWLIANYIMSIKFASYPKILKEIKRSLLIRAKNILEHVLK